jgi:hypothetical protein
MTQQLLQALREHTLKIGLIQTLQRNLSAPNNKYITVIQ